MLQIAFFNCKSTRSKWVWLFHWVFDFLAFDFVFIFYIFTKYQLDSFCKRAEWTNKWNTFYWTKFYFYWTLHSTKAEGLTSLLHTASKRKKQLVKFSNRHSAHTLLFSVATVALILFAERSTIFSLVNPKNMARGWCSEGFFGNNKKIF